MNAGQTGTGQEGAGQKGVGQTQTDTAHAEHAGQAGRRVHLAKAVHRSKIGSRAGLSERLFTWMFKGLVYPQIWEDPDIDMRALALGPDDRVLSIASGGCNILSYLTANPAQIIAVDLNTAHVALTKLKLAAAMHLPNHPTFYRFFGEADEKANRRTYKRYLRDVIDPATRSYWEGRDFSLRRRITLFSRDLYHHGLLGYFIGAAHLLARLYGIDPSRLMEARSLAEQRSFFERSLAPLFDKKMIRWITSKKASLYGLGIPPAQYEALASAADGDMALVLKRRLEKLTCGFSLNENYFTWQAFGRGYASGPSGPLPPYLQPAHFDEIRTRARNVTVKNHSLADEMRAQKPQSLDGYVLLDSQDWMTNAQLNTLWTEITRTARIGARVIFRTAAEPSLLPGRIDDAMLARWTYREETSHRLNAEDRSAIYGGFHLYTFNG